MEASLETTVNTDSVILLMIGLMVVGAFIVLISQMAKKA